MHGTVEEKPRILAGENVTPLRHSHIQRAATTWANVYAEDPGVRYIRDEERPTALSKAVDKILVSGILSILLRNKVALTINDGAAFVIAAPPIVETEPKGPLSRAIDWAKGGLFAALTRRFVSPERYKRNKELEDKSRKAISKVLGDRKKDMFNILILATENGSRRQGHGGSLLDAVTSLADILGKASWLISSNVQNTEFYHHHGFEAVGEFVLGEENPKWQHAPVVLKIMTREPRR